MTAAVHPMKPDAGHRLLDLLEQLYLARHLRGANGVLVDESPSPSSPRRASA